MDSKRIHYLLLSVSLVLCLLMLLDVISIPSKIEKETVMELNEYSSGSGEYFFHNYYIVTERGTHNISKNSYNLMRRGSEVDVYYSVITNAKQKLVFVSGNLVIVKPLGYAAQPVGLIFLSLLFFSILAVLFLYNRIKYISVRTNICFFIAISAITFFYFHLR